LGPLTTSALVSRWFTRRRALAIGIANIGISVGGFSLPLLIGHLGQTMEWRELFLLLGAGALLLALPPVLVLTISKPDDYEETTAEPGSGGSASPTHYTTRTLIADKGFWSLGLCVGAMYGVNVGILSNLVQIGLENGLDRATAAGAISVLALSGIIGKLTIGYLSDRLNNCLLLATVLLIFALALVLLAQAHGESAIIAASVLIGFSASSSLPLWHSLTAHLFGVANFSRVIGLTQLIVFPMVMAGPPVAGYIFDTTGSYDRALYFFTGLLGAAILLISGVRAKEKRVHQP
jgi:cyanate permease